MALILVQNAGEFGELLCDCGENGLHDHSDCTSGSRCTKCGVSTYYRDRKPTFARDGSDVVMIFICAYCESQEVVIWNNVSAANEMYAEGCKCQNNSDYCDYCEVIMDRAQCGSQVASPDESNRVEGQVMMKVQVGQTYVYRPVGEDADIYHEKLQSSDYVKVVENLGHYCRIKNDKFHGVCLTASLMHETQKWSWRFSNDQI